MMHKFTPSNPFKTLWAITFSGAYHMNNEQRLQLWRARYEQETGNKPVDLFTVAFCRTCNKPHWFNNAKHRHLTARCPGH